MKKTFKIVLPFAVFFFLLSPVLAENAYYNSLKLFYYHNKIFKEELERLTKRNTEILDQLEELSKDNNDENKTNKTELESELLQKKERINKITEVNKFCTDPFSPEWTKEKINDIIETVDRAVKITIDGILSTADELKNGKYNLPNQNIFSIPISTQSAIIDGTAKFLAERFREEATTLYIDKFKKRLESVPDLQTLYPKTYLFLKSADIFNYTSLGNDFKEAFEEDLKNSLGNLNNLLEKDNNKLKSILIEKKLYYPFSFSLTLSERLVNGDHPVEVLSFIENKYQNLEEGNGFYNYYNVVHGINIIQNNIQKIKENNQPLNFPQFENIWLKFSNLKEIDEVKEKEIFAALIYHEDTTYFKDVLDLDKDKATAFFKGTVYPIAEFLNTIENFQSKEQMLASDYMEVMDNTLKLIIHFDKMSGNKISEAIKIDINNKTETIYPLEFIEKSFDLYKSIYSKNYGYVVTNGLYITDKVLRFGGYDSKEVINITQAMSKYGGFMVDVVKAENSDDVKVLIQKNVTKFSYLDKRRSAFNITLSAHPGVYGGAEWLGKLEKSNVRANFGITAPIGFEFMLSCKNDSGINNNRQPLIIKNRVKYLSEGSWSLFASFADIGAAFNYRLYDAESQLPAELTFKQVFSPGISINRAFKNSPLTLGLGYQYTPELREVKVDNIETLKNSHRVMLRLSWDIPMIKIFDKINYKKE